MFTDEDKKEIAAIVAAAMQQSREAMREQRLAENARQEEAKETRLYLISLAGHHIAFPDDRGRAIFNQCVYARVSMNPTDPHFFGGSLEVVAYGDGKRLKQSVTLVLTGGSVIGMVAVSEDCLDT